MWAINGGEGNYKLSYIYDDVILPEYHHSHWGSHPGWISKSLFVYFVNGYVSILKKVQQTIHLLFCYRTTVKYMNNTFKKKISVCVKSSYLKPPNMERNWIWYMSIVIYIQNTFQKSTSLFLHVDVFCNIIRKLWVDSWTFSYFIICVYLSTPFSLNVCHMYNPIYEHRYINCLKLKTHNTIFILNNHFIVHIQ